MTVADDLREKLAEALAVRDRAYEPNAGHRADADALLPVVQTAIAEAVAAERERIARTIEAEAERLELTTDYIGVPPSLTGDVTRGYRYAARIAKAMPVREPHHAGEEER